MRPMLTGRATEAGTAAFARSSRAAPGHFRPALSVTASSIGVGTYLGRDDDATDALYRDAVGRALELGINVVDTAINYRNQRSERAVGAALQRSGIAREAVLVCTKGGFLPFDGVRPLDVDRYIEERFVRAGLLRSEDIVDGCHSLAPNFLADQIDRSRENLGVGTIDLYYLHNPETQLGGVSRAEFLRRLRDAFAALEAACDDGRIAAYGTATWRGYRLREGHGEHLALRDVLAAAREVGGAQHRFRAVQLPFNLELDEASTVRNQAGATLLEAARDAGIAVFASASVLQGSLAKQLAPQLRARFPGLRTDAQRAIQFVRSTPGIACALVGMKTRTHVDENAAVSDVPPLPA
jgi:aryl-alcohol dehydrogenase-like predicted oxidoreductase